MAVRVAALRPRCAASLPRRMATSASPAATAAAGVSARKKEARKAMTRRLEEIATEDFIARESDAILRHLEAHPRFASAPTVGAFVDCPRLREVRTAALVRRLLAREGASQAPEVFCPRVENREGHMRFLRVRGWDDLSESPPYGILEPRDGEHVAEAHPEGGEGGRALDILLVPGLAFDRKGGRLGRGGGYYDRFLARCIDQAASTPAPAALEPFETASSPPDAAASVSGPPLLVALALSPQIVDEEVPRDQDDLPVDVIVTPDETLICSERGQREWATLTARRRGG